MALSTSVYSALTSDLTLCLAASILLHLLAAGVLTSAGWLSLIFLVLGFVVHFFLSTRRLLAGLAALLPSTALACLAWLARLTLTSVVATPRLDVGVRSLCIGSLSHGSPQSRKGIFTAKTQLPA
jgi:hypothetical protein